MLQIMGYLGCAYLLVKSLELFGLAERYRTKQGWVEGMAGEEAKAWEYSRRGRALTLTAASLALIASLLFALWLYNQGDQFGQLMRPTMSYSECLRQADTVGEITACSPD
jgi:hypothetical protein